MSNYNDILNIFSQIIGIQYGEIAGKQYQIEYEKVGNAIGFANPPIEKLEKTLCYVVAEKLDIYREKYKTIIDTCASQKRYFNYPQKVKLLEIVNDSDVVSLRKYLISLNVNADLVKKVTEYKPYSNTQIIQILKKTLAEDDKQNDIINAIFSSFLYRVFPEKSILQFYSGISENKSFYDFLKAKYPTKYSRENALSVLHIDKKLFCKYDDYNEFLSSACECIKNQYDTLQNYCYFAIQIDPISTNGTSIQWMLYSDIVLFSEKYIEEKVKIGYFHPDRIREQTQSYINELDVEKCKFDICNGGFTYKDCFVISNPHSNNTEKEDFELYSILILLQKNKRDEDVIPCPTCRSSNVRGNSYPTIGVKSWECHNPICPDKSKYNRGKRYSISSIIKQEAIENIQNEIDNQSLSEWRLDVVPHKNDVEILEYLVKQYSFYGDSVTLINSPVKLDECFGRKINKKPYQYKPVLENLKFYTSCYFKRFEVRKAQKLTKQSNPIDTNSYTLINGNCYDVLKGIPDNTFDGAITSPPYYNAKSYSHWANIYCYLYDMYNHAIEVYRTMKNGGYYLFNIFDYFDNENNVVLSDMGKKRMILGAYIIHLFCNIGFKLQQNIIWYKGHIQGHRNTNQGNNIPYYQAPLNCYEHILCFRKVDSSLPETKFPNIVRFSPVIKMIKGKNVLGHSAPFPIDLPEILIKRLKAGVVLDPYSGTFTTTRCAMKYKIKSVGVEMSKDYCNIGIKLIEEEFSQTSLKLQ